MNTTKSTDGNRKFLLVRSGPVFALPISSVKEVMPYVALIAAPTAATFVKGMVNVGGVIVTVLSLGELLGQNVTPANLRSHIVWLRGSSMPLALLVEQALATVNSNSVSVSAVDSRNTFNGLVQAELLRGDECVAHLLDVAALLTEEETRRLADYSARAQARLESLEIG